MAKLARKAGLYTMMNSNGHLEEGLLSERFSTEGVFKVEVMGFTDDLHRQHYGRPLRC